MHILLLILSIITVSIGGVFATWHYAEQPAVDDSTNLNVSLIEFMWEPEEILPTESEIGENHLTLIELILNEKNKGYGLNYDKKQVLESYLNSKGYIFSNQKTTGGNIKFVSDETNQLYYCIEKVNGTLYNAYTFTYNDIRTAAGTNTKIVVYKTLLVKTDKWRATQTFFGYAPTKSLRDYGASNLSGELSYTIDFENWEQPNK